MEYTIVDSMTDLDDNDFPPTIKDCNNKFCGEVNIYCGYRRSIQLETTILFILGFSCLISFFGAFIIFVNKSMRKQPATFLIGAIFMS